MKKELKDTIKYNIEEVRKLQQIAGLITEDENGEEVPNESPEAIKEVVVRAWRSKPEIKEVDTAAYSRDRHTKYETVYRAVTQDQDTGLGVEFLYLVEKYEEHKGYPETDTTLIIKVDGEDVTDDLNEVDSELVSEIKEEFDEKYKSEEDSRNWDGDPYGPGGFVSYSDFL